jgi:4-amino-4-deoxy-L-arabinose transferase-like glycosyltransferase
MMAVLARLWAAREEALRPGWGLPALFWTAAALSVLIKGPIGLLVPAFTVAGLAATTQQWRWLKGLRWLPGLAWFLLLVSPWFIAIMVQTKGAFLQQSVGNDMLSKVAGGQEAHGAPPGTYLAASLFFFWPFVPLAIAAVPALWRRRKEPAILFLLAWLVPFWLVFEAVPTKLPHYVLPAYPALALLVAAVAVEGGRARGAWTRIVFTLVPLFAVAIPLALIGVGWYFDRVLLWAVLPFGVLAAGLAALAWRRYNAGADQEGLFLSSLAALVLFAAIGWAAIPAVPSIWPAPRLLEAAAPGTCAAPHYASLGYREPSLVFLGGTDVEMPDDAAEAAGFLAQAGQACRVAFIDQRQEGAFLEALAAAGGKAKLLGRAHAVNLQGNKPVEMAAYQAEP